MIGLLIASFLFKRYAYILGFEFLIDIYDEVLMGVDREIIGDSDTWYWNLKCSDILEFGFLFVCL